MSDEQLSTPVGARDHSQGDPNAPVTLVEYGDYECPDCGRVHPIIQRLQQRLGKRLRFVFRNFPLTHAHPHAQHAAEATESARARGGPAAYWALHDLIFEHQQDGPTALSDAGLERMASMAVVDGRAVLEDIDAHLFQARVREDHMSGVRSGVRATPTFFINGKRYAGRWDEASLADALHAAAHAGAAT